MVVLTAALVVAAVADHAAAHVEASVDENNRYLKLTPLGDRLRIAYTVFIGQRPGEALRRRLDHDRNGEIDDGEAAAYGEDMARHIRPAVALTLDGHPVPIDWRTVDVGLGTPSVTGGSLSIDLVGWACAAGAEHHALLRDTVIIDKPGETEIRLEDAPGVHYGVRRLGGRGFDGLDQKWTGAGGPLVLGLELAWTTDGAAPGGGDGRCAAETKHAPRRWLSWGVIAGAVALAAAGAAYVMRQRKVNG